MINSINRVKIYSPQFRGGKIKNTPAKEGANMIDEHIKKMVEELKLKIKEKKVPPFGEFDVVWSEFTNKDKSLDLTRCFLKISAIGNKGAENNRYLEVAALKDGSPLGGEIVIGHGTTKDILDKLNEQGIEQVIKEKFIKLAKDLEDV